MRIYANIGQTTIEDVVIATSDELMYVRTVDSFALSKRGTTFYDVTEDYTEFQDRYGNSFVDADAFEAYLISIGITDTPTPSSGDSNLDGGRADSIYTLDQNIDGGNA